MSALPDGQLAHLTLDPAQVHPMCSPGPPVERPLQQQALLPAPAALLWGKVLWSRTCLQLQKLVGACCRLPELPAVLTAV